jgi:diguanylate cyclase (GGDEF) domain
LLFLTGVKGVAYIVEVIKTFQELFINNISVIVVVITFLWVCTIVTCFTVYYLVQYIEKVNKELEKMKNQAGKDCLTGLNNTKNFTRLFNQAIENTTHKREFISVLVIDIDFFKKVNDIYGNLAGDSILKSVAYILSGACGKLDILGRIEGDKFSIVLAKCSNNKALEIGERIRAVIEKYPFALPNGKTIYITVSIGVATYPDTTEQPEVIFSQADKSLYYAKHTGKNKVCSIDKQA